VDEEELAQALTRLGFEWLKDKQVKGILERADRNHDGRIDLEEWMSEAPKTLRTNLIKLAKKNGGELGFLA
jgi:Ca2+-binding EF-hand superfamily protein